MYFTLIFYESLMLIYMYFTLIQESEDEDIAFCSQKCFERFVMVYRSIFKSGGLHSKLGQDPAFFSDKSPSAASLSPFPSTPPTIVSPRGSGFLTPNSSGERTPQLTPTTPTGAPMLMGGVESLTPTRQRQELEKIQGRKHKKDVPPKVGIMWTRSNFSLSVISKKIYM